MQSIGVFNAKNGRRRRPMLSPQAGRGGLLSPRILQRAEALLQGELQVIARLAETRIALGDEVALRLAQGVGGAATLNVQQVPVGVGDLAVEHAELRIGADRFLDRKTRGTAIERRMGVRRGLRT